MSGKSLLDTKPTIAIFGRHQKTHSAFWKILKKENVTRGYPEVKFVFIEAEISYL